MQKEVALVEVAVLSEYFGKIVTKSSGSICEGVLAEKTFVQGICQRRASAGKSAVSTISDFCGGVDASVAHKVL